MEPSSTDGPEVAPANLLVYDNLAFSAPVGSDDEIGDSGNGRIEAVARAPFAFRETETSNKKVSLNVEFFGDSSWTNILLFVHGVCESAETWTVQNLAKICDSLQWRMAVLELEGHGLSDGTPGLMGTSWKRCVQQVHQFCNHALQVDEAQKKISSSNHKAPQHRRFVLAGASLGGALAAYASQSIRKEGTIETTFAGTLLLCPAVGVDPSVVPHRCIVAALTVLSKVMPSVGIEGATPTEDPSHYNCPAWTKRNFKGPWPLGTSKMLLDVTSKKIPGDVESGLLNLLVNSNNKHRVVVISGKDDPVVPIEAVQMFVDGMKAKAKAKEAQPATATTIELVEIKKGDHGLLAQSVEDPEIDKTQKKTTNATIEQVKLFLKQCEEIDA